jgi:hypothetical protein
MVPMDEVVAPPAPPVLPLLCDPPTAMSVVEDDHHVGPPLTEDVTPKIEPAPPAPMLYGMPEVTFPDVTV